MNELGMLLNAYYFYTVLNRCLHKPIHLKYLENISKKEVAKWPSVHNTDFINWERFIQVYFLWFIL